MVWAMTVVSYEVLFRRHSRNYRIEGERKVLSISISIQFSLLRIKCLFHSSPDTLRCCRILKNISTRKIPQSLNFSLVKSYKRIRSIIGFEWNVTEIESYYARMLISVCGGGCRQHDDQKRGKAFIGGKLSFSFWEPENSIIGNLIIWDFSESERKSMEINWQCQLWRS